MPRVLVDDPHRQPVLGIGACVEVLDVEIAAPQEFHHSLKERIKSIRIKGRVCISPVHLIGGNAILHGEFVFGSAACVFARIGYQGAIVGEPAFIPANGVLHQGAGAQIAIDLAVVK